MIAFAGWITACVAHYQCHKYVRRAVESLLGQSYPWIRVIVVSDADPRPPWKELASISDPRLIRFHLPQNRGCFFCWEVAQLATPDGLFMMQDADDWADPHRAATLINALISSGASIAVSMQPQFSEMPDGRSYQLGMRWDRVVPGPTAQKFVVQTTLTEDFYYRAPHHGLLRIDALRRIGGYYGGFRIGWDTLLTNLLLMTGSITWRPEPLYYRLIRPESLTHSIHTGTASDYAARVSCCLRRLYGDCYGFYRSLRKGHMTSDQLADAIRWASRRYVTAEDQLELQRQADRLRRAMSTGASNV